MDTFRVDVLLNHNLSGFLFGFDPDTARLAHAVTLQVQAASATQAAEQASAIGNGAVAGLPPDAADQANAWQRAGLRSLSIGDVVVVHTPDGPMPYACQTFGLAALPSTPRVHLSGTPTATSSAHTGCRLGSDLGHGWMPPSKPAGFAPAGDRPASATTGRSDRRPSS